MLALLSNSQEIIAIFGTKRMSSIKINTVFNFLLSFSGILFPLLTLPYISRILTISDLGTLNKGTAVYTLFVNLGSFGLVSYGAREIARHKDNTVAINTIFSSVLFCHILTTIICFVAYILYIAFFISARNEKLIHLFYVALYTISPLSVEWLYMGKEEFRYIAVRSISVKVILFVLTFVLIHHAKDFLLYAFIFVASQGINFLYNIYHARLYAHFSFFNIKIRHVFFSAKFFYLQTLVAICYQNINQLLLAHDKVQLALFVRATLFSSLVAALIAPILNAIKPRLEYIISKDTFQYQRYIHNAFDCVISILLPIAFGIFSLALPIMTIFGGQQFAMGYRVLRITCISMISTQLSVFLNTIISIPAGYEKNTVVSNTLVAITSLPLNFLLVPRYGAMGAAFSLLVAETLGLFCHLYLIKKHSLYLGWFVAQKSKYVIATMLMTISVVFLTKKIANLYIQCAVGILVGGIIYALSVLFLSNLFKDSKPYIFSVISNQIKRIAL